jgi:phospholipase C
MGVSALAADELRKRVQHVFVLMLENRSFDHLLGFSNITGTDVRTGASTAVEGLTNGVYANDAGGQPYVASPGAPFALDVDPGHSFNDVLEQLCGNPAKYVSGSDYPARNMSGFASNFVQHSGGKQVGNIMACFGPEQLPVLNALAKEFCVCDHWYSSMPGPTMPNRFFVHAASSGGLDDSPDLAILPDEIVSRGFAFPGGTIFDQLKDKIPWAIWEGDEFPTSVVLRGMLDEDVEETLGAISNYRDLSDFPRAVADPSFQPAYNFIEPSYGGLLFGAHMKCGSSMHPVDDVTRGECLIKRVYEAIRNSPHWGESLLIITFDEHGGFYDHDPPPAAVKPSPNLESSPLNRSKFTFEQLGVRVPTILVSPWIPKNSIDHTPYDHSSVPKTLEEIFGLDPMSERDRQASSVCPALDLEDMRTDALTKVPLPAVSNVGGCDGWIGTLERLVSEVPHLFRGDHPPTAVTQTFVHAAVRRELQMSGRRVVEALVDRIRRVKTQRDAAGYMGQVRRRYQAFKRDAMGGR